MLTDED